MVHEKDEDKIAVAPELLLEVSPAALANNVDLLAAVQIDSSGAAQMSSAHLIGGEARVCIRSCA